jgi:hypothetical protein
MHIKDELAGKRIKCPGCGSVLTVPDKEEADADDLLTPSVKADPPLSILTEPDVPNELERKLYRPPEPPPRKPRRRPPAERREAPTVAVKKGWLGSLNARVGAGLLVMIIAGVWFVVGLMDDEIYIYPLVLFGIGLMALLWGVLGRAK